MARRPRDRNRHRNRLRIKSRQKDRNTRRISAHKGKVRVSLEKVPERLQEPVLR